MFNRHYPRAVMLCAVNLFPMKRCVRTCSCGFAPSLIRSGEIGYLYHWFIRAGNLTGVASSCQQSNIIWQPITNPKSPFSKIEASLNLRQIQRNHLPRKRIACLAYSGTDYIKFIWRQFSDWHGHALKVEWLEFYSQFNWYRFLLRKWLT